LSSKKSKVVHLIPSDGLGGVEAAARSLKVKESDDVKVWFMSGRSLSNKEFIVEVAPENKLGSISSYILTFLALMRVRPSLLVCSLWRSTLVGCFYKLFFPWKKVVIMLHSQRYAHLADRLVTNLGSAVCDEIWCDSKATRDCLLSNKRKVGAKIISFLVKVPSGKSVERHPLHFVYWGRLVKKKRVELAVEIFHEVTKVYPNARFCVYGPDGGKRGAIESKIASLGLEESVALVGDKPPDHFDEYIRGASFFLNPSTHEGMGMAVIEAMQLGIVPVVTPVGEIKHYCEDGLNSLVFFGDVSTAVEKILLVIESYEKWPSLSSNAKSTWSNKSDYSEDFLRFSADMVS